MDRDPSLPNPNFDKKRRVRAAAVVVALGGSAFLASACSSSTESVDVRVACSEPGTANKGKIVIFGDTSASNSIEYNVSDGKKEATYSFHNGVLSGGDVQTMLFDADAGNVLEKFPDATLVAGKPTGIKNEFNNGGYSVTLKCNNVQGSQIAKSANVINPSRFH